MKLYSFQEKAVAQMLQFLEHNETKSCFNASEMGTGKTIMAIKAVLRLGCRKILVLCPATMRLVWAEEIEAWTVNPQFKIYLTSVAPETSLTGPIKNSDSFMLNQWTIVSYDLAHRPSVLRELQKPDYDAVIFDECHYLKNRKAKRTKAALGNLFAKATYHIFLSGTPFTTRVIDGFNVFYKCNPTNFPNFFNFVSRFSYQKVTPFGVDYFGVKNPKELSTLIRSNFYLRVTKEEALPELPNKIFQRITLPESLAICPKRDTSNTLDAEVAAVIQAINAGKTPVVPNSLAEHRRLQGEAKVPPVADFVQNLLNQDIPVILFAWHKNVIGAFREIFASSNPAVITGETPAGERNKAVHDFQDSRTLLFIGNILAGGIGITLTRSHVVVLAELDWSPANVSQAIDRCHRIGQNEAVLVYYFVVKNSLDESITNVVMSRARTFKSVLNEE